MACESVSVLGKNGRYTSYRRAANFHLKSSATYILGVAIKHGLLVRPDKCQDCGGEFRKIIAHHEDYAKPTDVEWLCHGCHRERHHPPSQGSSNIAFNGPHELKQAVYDAATEQGVSMTDYLLRAVSAIPDIAKRLEVKR